MSHRLTSIVGLPAAVALVIGVASDQPVRAAQATKRTVHVSVLNKDLTPVTDMQPADFEVKEGGKVMEIVSVKRATTPLRVAIIDSDAGTGAYQQGLLQFMQKLLDANAEFSITSVIVQPTKVVDYTSDVAALSKALEAVGRRGTTTGGAQVMEAIYEATKTVRKEGRRPVIVVMRFGPEGTSSLNPKDVREELRKSGAILEVLSFRGMDRVSTGPTNQNSMDSYTQQAQLRQNEVAEGQQNLQLVLGDGSRESGGHHEQIVSVSVARNAELLADELLNQYEIVYALPDGVKPSDKLSVSTKRKNVNVYAPNRPPQ